MTIWKLINLHGGGEYVTSNGNVLSVGRSPTNVIKLISAVVSRNHCSITFLQDKVIVIDLQSSNGVFISGKKIDPSVPTVAKDSDIIGIGWCSNIPVMLENEDKCEFKVVLTAYEKIDVDNETTIGTYRHQDNDSNENALVIPENRGQTPVHYIENNMCPIITDVRSLSTKVELFDTSEPSAMDEIPNVEPFIIESDTDSDNTMPAHNSPEEQGSSNMSSHGLILKKNNNIKAKTKPLNDTHEMPPEKKSTCKSTRVNAQPSFSNSNKTKEGKITKKKESQKRRGKN